MNKTAYAVFSEAAQYAGECDASILVSDSIERGIAFAVGRAAQTAATVLQPDPEHRPFSCSKDSHGLRTSHKSDRGYSRPSRHSSKSFTINEPAAIRLSLAVILLLLGRERAHDQSGWTVPSVGAGSGLRPGDAGTARTLIDRRHSDRERRRRPLPASQPQIVSVDVTLSLRGHVASNRQLPSGRAGARRADCAVLHRDCSGLRRNVPVAHPQANAPSWRPVCSSNGTISSYFARPAAVSSTPRS